MKKKLLIVSQSKVRLENVDLMLGHMDQDKNIVILRITQYLVWSNISKMSKLKQAQTVRSSSYPILTRTRRVLCMEKLQGGWEISIALCPFVSARVGTIFDDVNINF